MFAVTETARFARTRRRARRLSRIGKVRDRPAGTENRACPSWRDFLVRVSVPSHERLAAAGHAILTRAAPRRTWALRLVRVNPANWVVVDGAAPLEPPG